LALGISIVASTDFIIEMSHTLAHSYDYAKRSIRLHSHKLSNQVIESHNHDVLNKIEDTIEKIETAISDSNPKTIKLKKYDNIKLILPQNRLWQFMASTKKDIHFFHSEKDEIYYPLPSPPPRPIVKSFNTLELFP